MSFRRYQPSDLQQCLELHDLNRPGRLPETDPTYRQCLERQSSYTLVTERDDRIVATGGVAYTVRRNIPVLSFGLVHPDFQGKGIGTALVLSRLALLKADEPVHTVFIFAVRKSIGYYRRLGFLPFQPWQDPEGNEHPSGILEFLQRDVRDCRKLLAAHRISFPPDEDQVPLRELPTGPTSQAADTRPA